MNRRILLALAVTVCTHHPVVAQGNAASAPSAASATVPPNPRIVLLLLNNGAKINGYPFVRPPQLGELVVLKGGLRWTVKRVTHAVDANGTPVLEVGVAPPPPPQTN